VKHQSILIRAAVNFAWQTFQLQYRLLIAMMLIIFGLWVILEIVVIAGQRFGLLWWTAAHLAFFISFACLEVRFLQVCLDLYDGRVPLFDDPVKYLSRGLKFLAGQILYLLITLTGLVLLVIPGIYLNARYAFVGFCQVAGQENLPASFEQSARLSTGNMASLMIIIGSLLFFNFIGACLLGIGLLVTIPLSVLTMTAVYKQLCGQV
jgi:hypothetical protein